LDFDRHEQSWAKQSSSTTKLIFRESLVELIASEGFRVAQASDGEEASELCAAARLEPDVVFSDLRMPKLDGLCVLRVIQEEKLTSVPVIVVSAFGDSSKMIEAMRLGAYDYITSRSTWMR